MKMTVIKTASLLLASIMILCSCGGNTEESDSSSPNTKTTTKGAETMPMDTTQSQDVITSAVTESTIVGSGTVTATGSSSEIRTTTSVTKSGTSTTAKIGTTTTQPADNQPYIEFRKSSDTFSIGVWWWNLSMIKLRGDAYLNFLEKNKVTEIYLCATGMKESGSGVTFADVRSFVKKAKAKGIRVAYLTGDYIWIEPNNKGFQAYVDHFNAYQAAASADEKFYAMHLDVEPHQHSKFKTDRATVMQWFADLTVNKAAPAAKAAGTLLEWDIPFWLTDEVKDKDGNTMILGELMAKYCDTISIMSYRDTASAMYDVSKEEIAFAKKHGAKIVLGAETYSQEGDMVSYMEEGKQYMYNELDKLNIKLKQTITNGKYGLAIHHMTKWYDLQN